MLQGQTQTNVEYHSTVYIACLDIEKAFDKVWQNGLLYKLYQKGLNQHLWKIISDSFRDFKCCISIAGMRSDWFTIVQGVHQGGPLSGLLHQLYIDDMLNQLLQSGYGAKIYDIDVGCPTFADDVELVILSPIGLQNMLDICFRYSGKWKFKFSILKYKYDLNNPSSLPSTPYATSLLNNIPWSIVSNAFLRSIKTAPTKFPLSNPFRKSSYIFY